MLDRCQELVGRGVAAAAIEAVDLSAVTRARDATGPDAVDAVARVYERVAPQLGALE